MFPNPNLVSRNTGRCVYLDGAKDIEKSTLLRSLGQPYATLTRKGQKTGQYGRYDFDVDGLPFNLDVYDVSNSPVQESVDLIIEVFAINKPKTLKEIINVKIPFIKSKRNLKNTPMILVGIKSELRQESKSQQSELCSTALGQNVAYLVGAESYVECSVKTGQGVHEVFEKGIRASLKSNIKRYQLITESLKLLLLRKLPLSADWRSVIHSIHSQKTLLQHPSPELQYLIELVDKHLFDAASESRDFPLEDIWFYRELEIDINIYCLATFPQFGIERTQDIHSKLSSKSVWWCIDAHKHQTSNDVKDLTIDLVCRESRTSMLFIKQECCAIEEFLLACAPIKVQRLVIINCIGILSFSFLSALVEGLEFLVIVDTNVDFTGLNFPSSIVHSLTHLVLNKCEAKTLEVPPVLGRLHNLKVLDIASNAFTKLPVSFGGLHDLQCLQFDRHQMIFPPAIIVEKSTQDIIEYLKAIQEEPVENKEAKLMVVGQERVGKSTLVKSLMRKGLRIFKTTPPGKTDGVNISVLELNGINCKIYDLAGDVEYLNTHTLFFSSNCLHLAVFNMSQFTVSSNLRSTDQLSRLELWLQTIACQDPCSCAIVVGTHADHDKLSPEVRSRIRTLLGEIIGKYLPQHRSSYFDECLLCNPDKFCADDPSISHEFQVAIGSSVGIETATADIPHILGYFEVSAITNKNMKELKLKLGSSVANLKLYTVTETLPKIWLKCRQTITTKLSEDENLQKTPFLPLAQIHDLANKVCLTRQQSIVAMLRFFHSQGDFLWYEDIPEMKDVVILDPKWLSDQLRSLISYRPSADSINEGVLHHSELPKLWEDMTEENRSKLISLFRSVGLCFSISEDEELFPCKLPVGWPDREMWPPLPNSEEKQTSLIFMFSFIPPTFFPDLIVVINKMRDSFVHNVPPFYYRFNVVYITQEQYTCPFHEEKSLKTSRDENDCNNKQNESSYHRIHFELMPCSNSLKVTIRGHYPCCMVPNIRSLIEDIISRRYPSIAYKDRIICPECEFQKVQNPSSFELNDSHVQFCPLGHKVGSLQDILVGKPSSSDLVSSVLGQSGRIFGETLEDHLCPKLFAVLPINLDSLSLLKRFVYSYLRDGYAVHLLCECPGEWHFLPSPGFRVGKPKEFFKKYGSRVCKLLRVISALSAPFKIASAIEPHCKAGAAVSEAGKCARKELQSLLQNYLDEYPHLKSSIGSSNDDLKDLKSSRGLQRTELSRFLEVKSTGHNFGPLVCTYVDKFNEWLWLCEEHNQKYGIVERL